MFLLQYMAEYLSGARQLQVRVTSGCDVAQPPGQRIEFRQVRQVTLVHPARMRIDEGCDDGKESLVLFDRNNLWAFDPGRKVVAAVSRPGDIDGVLRSCPWQTPLPGR
jgi:hypothetical protein